MALSEAQTNGRPVASWLPVRGFSPRITLAFPERITGRHPRLNFSRFAQASLTLRPVDLLTHLSVGLVGRLRRRPLPNAAASQLLRHTDILLRRDLHPLVFCA